MVNKRLTTGRVAVMPGVRESRDISRQAASLTRNVGLARLNLSQQSPRKTSICLPILRRPCELPLICHNKAPPPPQSKTHNHPAPARRGGAIVQGLHALGFSVIAYTYRLNPEKPMIATLNTKARDARVLALRVVTERNTDELQRNAKAPAFQSNRQNPFAQQPFAEARAMCFAAA